MAWTVGLIGHPVGHSISPIFQQAAIDEVGLSARYEAWDTEPQALAARVARLREPDCWGANVTIPHKEAVIPLLDEIDLAARHIGAVNTIVNREGRLYGHNTDVVGFRRALQDLGFAVTGCDVVVLGAGGAARAIVFALIEDRARSITVVNRTAERAQRLVQDMLPLTDGDTMLKAVTYTYLAEALKKCRLLVNCTSVGLKGSATDGQLPLAADLIPTGSGLLVYDLIASPPVTPLVQAARDRGVRAEGGLSMLVLQGAASFELWTGQPAPLRVMMQAATKAMAG